MIDIALPLTVGIVCGLAIAILAALVGRAVVVPAYLLKLFGTLPKTMRFDLATPQSLKTMVVLAVPPLEPWFSERAAGAMLTTLRHRFPPHHTTRDAFPYRREKPVGAAAYYPADVPPVGVTLPSEYGPLDGVMLAWPWHYPSRWPAHAKFVRAILDAQARVLMLTENEQDLRELDLFLRGAGIDTGKIDYLCGPVDDVWVRDYGPTIIRCADGRHAIVANAYAPSEHPYRKGDNAVPFTVGAVLDLPIYRLPLLIEGGNMVSDGHGMMVVTTSVLERNPELDRDEVGKIMHQYFGCDRAIFIQPLPAEVTGHADMVLRFVDAHNVVIASAPSRHRWSAHFDRLAEQFASMSAFDGKPLEIHRLPIAISRGSGSDFWSYVNCTQVNGHTIVPQFGLPSDETALDFYRKLTGGTVTGIDYSDFLVGSVHCQSKEIPLGAMRDFDRRKGTMYES